MYDMLASKTPTEAIMVAFDFSRVLAGTIGTSSVSASVLAGTDPVNTLTLGPPTVSAGVVSVLASRGVNDSSYLMTCTVTESGGITHQLAAAITVTTAAA